MSNLDEMMRFAFNAVIVFIAARIYISLTYPGSLLLRGMQRRVFLLQMRNESRRIRHGDAHRYVEGRCNDAGTDLRRFKKAMCNSFRKINISLCPLFLTITLKFRKACE